MVLLQASYSVSSRTTTHRVVVTAVLSNSSTTVNASDYLQRRKWATNLAGSATAGTILNDVFPGAAAGGGGPGVWTPQLPAGWPMRFAQIRAPLHGWREGVATVNRQPFDLDPHSSENLAPPLYISNNIFLVLQFHVWHFQSIHCNHYTV